jgi:hypothetical protein
MNIKLTEQEIKFLEKLATGKWRLKNDAPRAEIRALIARGYCCTFPERLGPLGISSGDTSICLTEAGETLLSFAQQSIEESHKPLAHSD